MRRTAAIIVIIALTMLSGCTQTPADQSTELSVTTIQPSPVITPAQTPAFSPSPTPTAYTAEEIGSFFDMEKEELLAKLSPGKQPFCMSNEGYWYSSFYRDLADGFAAAFFDGGEKEYLLCMNFGIGKGLHGLQPEMRFADIQKALGEGKITKTWRESPENEYYSLIYEQKGFTVEFLSGKQDGAGWYMECWKSHSTAKPKAPKPFASKYPELKADSELLESGITLGDISQIAGMNNYELMKRMGIPDETGPGGVEGQDTCYVYKEAGLLIEISTRYGAFDTEAEDAFDLMTDDGTLTLNGIYSHGDMDFDMIQECLGKGTFKKDVGSYMLWEEEATSYDLCYDFNNFMLDFCSSEEDGTDWVLVIHHDGF